MIKCLRHFPFVKWYPVTRCTAEAVTGDGVGPLFLLQLLARAEEVRVVRHMEHGRIADWPNLELRIVFAVHEDRQAAIDCLGEGCVPACSAYRRSPGVRNHTRPILIAARART